MTKNWNTEVSVKLTEDGIRFLEEYNMRTYGPYYKDMTPRMVDFDGRTYFLLWELMQIFGPKISSCRPLFERGEIKFEED